MASYITRYRRDRRASAIAFLGGACASCGSTTNLEFDHIDPDSKVKAIASMLTASKERFWTEVRKCQLLCSACHLERSRQIGLLSIAPWNKGAHVVRHGTETEYRAGCRCDACKANMRQVRLRRKRGGVGVGEPRRPVKPLP